MSKNTDECKNSCDDVNQLRAFHQKFASLKMHEPDTVSATII